MYKSKRMASLEKSGYLVTLGTGSHMERASYMDGGFVFQFSQSAPRLLYTLPLVHGGYLSDDADRWALHYWALMALLFPLSLLSPNTCLGGESGELTSLSLPLPVPHPHTHNLGSLSPCCSVEGTHIWECLIPTHSLGLSLNVLFLRIVCPDLPYPGPIPKSCFNCPSLESPMV